MSLEALATVDVIEVMENFLNKRRPPVGIRQQLDIAYRIENQSIYIYEVRPRWDKPDEILHGDVAKATFVKSKNIWKVYWLRSNLKWYPYEPKPEVKTLKEFVDLVDEDKHHCFWG